MIKTNRVTLIKPAITQRNTSAGFTLIEIIVSTAIFVIVVGALLSLFNYSLKINRRTEALRQASQGMRNLVEFLTKEIRNGQIDYGIIGGSSVSPVWQGNGLNPCSNPSPTVGADTYKPQDNRLAIFTEDGLEECIYYGKLDNSWVGSQVFNNNSGGINLALQKTGISSIQSLNPPNFRVDYLAFFIRPTRDPYTPDPVTHAYVKIQPSVTLDIKFAVQLPTGEYQNIYYQTTISSNKYDIAH
jgi:prepilin-type N-terminal cleavage/methylation domain-containing protein